ncbi:MAG: FAD-dependent oxidoreductase [Candidatus Cloacimonadota bacterium]|nr:FAD-dependent oxidoreductase [Candidatus Cloacimonadota bacterium]
MNDIIKIKLNGKEVSGKSGQTILDIAKEHNIEIPTLCHDDYLKPSGSCWVCVVWVKDKGFVPSCATEINEGMEIETDSKDVLATRKMALELLLSDHYADCIAPCSIACPAHIDVQGYIALINNGEYHEATKLIKERLPLPLSVGRICPAFCEKECRRQLVDKPIAIRQIKRYAADKDLEDPANTFMPEIKPNSGKEVVIIGAGPAGLTAAYYLTKEGHKCTIFEAMPKNGGMMRYGIPEYRLPKEVLDKEISLIEKMGVEIKNNLELGKDFTLQFLYKGYDAVFLGMGAWQAVSLRMEGEDLENCYLGIDFLRKVTEGEITKLKGTVAVVGGGNTAIDAARTSRRLGAEKVMIVYRRAEEQMPAEDIEIADAKEEGVEFHLLQNPTKIIGKDGKVNGLQCVKMRLGEPDSSGRKRPIAIENSEFIIKIDHLIPAISQKPVVNYLEEDSSIINSKKIVITRWNSIGVNEKTKQTNIEKIFSGGDVVRGPSTVVESVADAYYAAYSMNQFLAGKEVAPLKEKFNSKKAESVKEINPEEYAEYEKADRVKSSMLKPADRIGNFKEVEKTFTEREVREETARCIECGCEVNQTCALRQYATDYEVIVSKYMGELNKHPIDDSHPFILRDSNKCIDCGRCIRTCLDIQGVGALGFINRGFGTLVAPEFNESLLNTSCESCGKCIDVCPVGALTSRNTQMKTAPIPLEKVATTCTLCGDGCSVNYFTNSNKIFKAEARKDELTGQNICFNAHFGFEVLQSAERLTEPMIRVDNELVEVSWEKAYDFIQDNSNKIGIGSALFSNGNFTNEELYLIDQVAKKFDISRKYSWSLNDSAVADKIGINYSPNPITDLQKTDLIVLIGDISPALGIKIIKAVKDGKKLLVINSKENKFTKIADHFIKTDNYIEILNDFAKIFVEYRHHNVEYIVSSVENFVEYNHGLQKVQHSREFEKYVKLISDYKVLFTYSESYLDYNTQNAVINLSTLKGNIGEVGTGIITSSEISNKSTLLSYGFESPKQITSIKSAIMLGEDPLYKNEMQRYEWLNNLEFLVVADCFLTETAKMADVILPLATFIETNGSIFSNNIIRKVNKVIEPICSKDNIEILSPLIGKSVSLNDIEKEIENIPADQNEQFRLKIQEGKSQKISMEFNKEPSFHQAKVGMNSVRERINKFKKILS